jgi:HEAT repeat protein
MRAFPHPIRDVKRASLLAAALTLGGAVAVFWFGTARTMNVRPQWTPGKAFVYELSTRGEGIDTPAALFGNVSVPGQRYTVGVDGRLRATVLRANDDGATVAWTVDSPKAEFAADGKIDAAYSAALTRDLGGSFVTRSDGDGRVVAFLGDRRATDLGNAYMRALTSTFEIAQPQQARGFGRAWQADETDVDGARTSEYALQLWLDNPIALPTARFTRDATIRSPRGDDPFAVEPRVIAKCFDQGLLREDGVLAHIVATERRAVNVGDRRIATSQSTVIATLVAISRVPEGSLSRETENALSHADGLRVVRNRADVRAAAYRRAAAATTSDAVFAKLQTLPLRATNVTALSQELAAQFFVHPQTIARVAATLRSAPADSAPFAAVALALQNAGTSRAQELVSNTMLARASDPASEALAASLARVAMPSDASVAALEVLAQRNAARRGVAELSLGTAASTLGHSDRSRAWRIAARLATDLQHARSAAAKRTLLLALGNAHVAETVATILPYASDPDARLRAAAASALRGIRDPRADEALRALVRDPDDAVRLSSALAFRARDLDDADYAAIVRTARDDGNRDVRVAAVDVLADACDERPEARDVLLALSKDAGDVKISATAASDLQHLDALAAVQRV